MDCERLCSLPRPGAAGEGGWRGSLGVSVLTFCRGGSRAVGGGSSRSLRLRESTVEALRPRAEAAGGEAAVMAGDLAEPTGLVSLVWREVVRLLGEAGTGLFASHSERCVAPFGLTWRSSSLHSRLTAASSTTVSASESSALLSPWCGRAAAAAGPEGGMAGGCRSSPLLGMTHEVDSTRGRLPHVRQGRAGRQGHGGAGRGPGRALWWVCRRAAGVAATGR